MAEEPRIIGFVCDWAVSTEGELDENNNLKALPHVNIIKVPCSGYVKSEWLELALRSGAKGVFVVGCPIIDCHYREGNKWVRDRVRMIRPPKLNPRRGGDPNRVRCFFRQLIETSSLIEDLKQFTEELKEYEASLVRNSAPAQPAQK